jgi:hypothetical protein
MGLAVNILTSWRHPRQVMARHLACEEREDRAFMYLILACVLIYVSRWPGLARLAQVDPSTPLEIRLGGALFAWIFIVPLVLYLIAAVSRLTSGLFGGRGSWYSARLALFWSLLAVTPLWLLNGLIEGYALPKLIENGIGAIALAAFAVIWLSSLIEAEFGGDRT